MNTHEDFTLFSTQKDFGSKKINLKSSVEKQGNTITQIITCTSGIKKTFRGIKSDTIEQGEFTHFETNNGRLVLINTKNVAWVEVFKEN